MSKARKSGAKTKTRKVPANTTKTTRPTASLSMPKRSRQPRWQNFRHGFLLIRDSVALYRRNPSRSLLFYLLPLLVLVFGSTLANSSKQVNTTTIIGACLSLFAIAWEAVNGLSAYSFSLLISRNRQPNIIATYRRNLRFVPRIIGANIFCLLLTVLAACLFIIPGIIVARRYYLVSFYIVDRDTGIREAMQLSAADSKPVSFRFYGLATVMILVTGASAALTRFVPIVGAAASVALGTLLAYAPAILYEQIRHKSGPA